MKLQSHLPFILTLPTLSKDFYQACIFSVAIVNVMCEKCSAVVEN